MQLVGVGLFAMAGLLSLQAASADPAAPVPAAADKYDVSPQEKLACTRDAMRLCFNTYPDEDALLSCMKTNHASLSATCRVAFDAGVRRRHL